MAVTGAYVVTLVLIVIALGLFLRLRMRVESLWARAFVIATLVVLFVERAYQLTIWLTVADPPDMSAESILGLIIAVAMVLGLGTMWRSMGVEEVRSVMEAEKSSRLARVVRDLERAQKELARQKEFAEALVETANILVVGFDENAHVRVFNRAAEEITGYDRRDVIGRSWYDTVVPRERFPEVWLSFERYRTSVDGPGPSLRIPERYENPILSRDGEERIISWRNSEIDLDDEGRIGIAFGIDVTESRRRALELEYLASHDPLTGLPNRRSFENAVEKAVARARRGRPSVLFFADIDDFKLCNDEHGHAFGDSVLVEIARRLAEQIREVDEIARLGGDEFGVLLEEADLDDAREVAERMREAVRSVDARGALLDLSIGVAWIEEDCDYESALMGADAAMYEAKDSGSKFVVHGLAVDEVK